MRATEGLSTLARLVITDSASVMARLEIVVERVSPVAAESRANAWELTAVHGRVGNRAGGAGGCRSSSLTPCH